MKYTKEERLDIGRRIYDGELSRYQAAKEYDIGEQTARNYMRMYRDLNGLPAKRGSERGLSVSKPLAEPASMEEFESMTKERKSCIFAFFAICKDLFFFCEIGGYQFQRSVVIKHLL